MCACCRTRSKSRSSSRCTSSAGISTSMRLRTALSSLTVARAVVLIARRPFPAASARGGTRTPTVAREILSLVRLPIPPLSRRATARLPHNNALPSTQGGRSQWRRPSSRRARAAQQLELDRVVLPVAHVERRPRAAGAVDVHRPGGDLDAVGLQIALHEPHVGRVDAETKMIHVRNVLCTVTAGHEIKQAAPAAKLHQADRIQ